METKIVVDRKNRKVLVASVNIKSLELIKNEDVILLVSVGKEKFEGEDLEAQINFISAECKSCTIVVADELQRFNIASENSFDPEFTMKHAREISLKKGDEWIERNRPLFEEKFRPGSYKIVRWNEWINDEAFVQKKKEIEERLANDPEYAAAMKFSVDEYQKRLQNHLGEEKFSKLSKEALDRNGKDYLVEECAVFLSMAAKGKKYILYPGGASRIIKQTFEKLIKPFYEKALAWISERFRRVKPEAVQKKSQDSSLAYSVGALGLFPFRTAHNTKNSNSEELTQERIFAKTTVNSIRFYLMHLPTTEQQQEFLGTFQKEFQDEFSRSLVPANKF